VSARVSQADEADDHAGVQGALEVSKADKLAPVRAGCFDQPRRWAGDYCSPACRRQFEITIGMVSILALRAVCQALLRLPLLRLQPARSSRRIWKLSAATAACEFLRSRNVPISSAVMPQKVQNRNGYFLGSWCVAWVRYPAKRRVALEWHFWQVATTLARLRCERGSVTGWMSCEPWQSSTSRFWCSRVWKPCRDRSRSTSWQFLRGNARRCHDVELEAGLISAADGMSGVAVAADRQRPCLSWSRLPSGRSGRTALGCHGGSYRRFRAHSSDSPWTPDRSGEFSVRGVTTGTGCSDRQAALQQALAVDALGVVLNDSCSVPV
jgi:hypothetical protein